MKRTPKRITDLNYHGYVNTLPSDDKRIPRFLKQHATKGFDDTETWCLYCVIAHFTLPRLKRFREIPLGFPGRLSVEKWDAILGKMIRAFELIIEDAEYKLSHLRQAGGKLAPDEHREIEEGLDLFRKWFLHLWT